MKVLDLFCGCGGLSLGFEQAGFTIYGGVDFNQSAIDTYHKNFPNSKAICFDLLNMSKNEIAKQFPDLDSVDVIIGGPPCQGFSSANRYQKEGKDPRNKLFFQFVKFVDIVLPKAIVIENVKGIITKDNGYALKRITAIFEKRGYSVVHKILKATDFGVPQRRSRNFFVMLKNSEGVFDFDSMNKTNEVITVKEAIGELYQFEKGYKKNKSPLFLVEPAITNFQKYLRSSDNSLYNHEIRYPAQKVQNRISYVKQGENWESVPEDLWPSQRTNRQSSAYKRLDENKPSVTIDTGNNHSNYFHPLFNRIPSVREAARLQSFPDSFLVLGNRSEQFRQVGNAVPPLLAKALAIAIMEKIGHENQN